MKKTILKNSRFDRFGVHLALFRSKLWYLCVIIEFTNGFEKIESVERVKREGRVQY